MILVFGSINLDFFFKCSHLPGPGETVLCPKVETSPGGKGANQALAASRAGSKVLMAGAVGSDDLASQALVLLAEDGVDLSLVQATSEPTACASIAVAPNGENSIVVGSGANLMLKAEQVPDTVLGPDTTLVLQMEVPLEENWALIERAHGRGTRIVLNVAPAGEVPDRLLAMIDVLLVNEIEARQLAHCPDAADFDFRPFVRRISQDHDLTGVITLGAAGSIAFTKGRDVIVPALKVEVADTTGAGDCFAGVLAARLDQGATWETALTQASVASGLCCTRFGAQTSFPSQDAIATASSPDWSASRDS